MATSSKHAIDIPPNMDGGIGLYCLSLCRDDTKARPFWVERAEWYIFAGELTRVNPLRVSMSFGSKESAAVFCREYTAEHPGVATNTKALERVAEMVAQAGQAGGSRG